MGIKRQKTLYNSSAAGNGTWFALDTRYEDDGDRTIQVSLEVGDSVTIEGTTQDERGIDKSFLDDLTTADISTLAVFTDSDSITLEGAWTYIRAVKTGTNGTAKVQGVI